MGNRRGENRVSMGKPKGNRPLGRLSSRWENNIRMELQEVGRGGMTGLIWLRIVTGGGLL